MSIRKQQKKAPFPAMRSRMGASRYIPGATISSSSKRSVIFAASDKTYGQFKPPVQVFDENGMDVTPLSLLQLDPVTLKRHQSIVAETSEGSPTDVRSSMSAFKTTGHISTLYGAGPFSRSVFSQSHSETSDSMADEVHGSIADFPAMWGGDIQHIREVVKEVVTDEDKLKVVTIILNETPTIWLLDLPGVVSIDDEEQMTLVKKENERYSELKKNRTGNDLYTDHGMNTFNEPYKYKNTQTNKIGHHDVGVNVTKWDMFDTYADSKNMNKEALGPEIEQEAGDIDQAIYGTDILLMDTDTSQADGSSVAGSSLMYEGRESVPPGTLDSDRSVIDDKLLYSESFKDALFVMERAINLNTFQNKLALYRDLPIIQDYSSSRKSTIFESSVSVSDMGPHVDRLWGYTCPLTKGHNVSCLIWNKGNPDLLAVGHGQFEFNGQKPGIVSCWSLKNPSFPERIFTCTSGILALDFSSNNPNYLAAGLHNGGIAVFNIQSNKDESIIDNFDSPGKHIAPVWQIQWIKKDQNAGGTSKLENLVTISADGHVTQWNIRKGFEYNDLIKLRRLATRMQGKGREKKEEAYISRYTAGYAFDFHPTDKNIYLVATEDSHIHKCSRSYNEQYLDTFYGHMEPVYKVKWSPFEPQLFLSCSADWSVKLWHLEKKCCIITFHSSAKAVYDICWSPTSSAVFACVTEEAVEVWDLSVSTLDPVIKNSGMSSARMTSVVFAKNSESLLVGDSDGVITVFQLKCLTHFKDKSDPSATPLEKKPSLILGIAESLLANQLTVAKAVSDLEIMEYEFKD